MTIRFLLTILAFIPLYAIAQVDTTHSGYQTEKRTESNIELPKQRIRDAGVAQIIGGTFIGIGLGTLMYHLEKPSDETKFGMYGFFSIGTAFIITSGGLKAAAFGKKKERSGRGL